MQHNVVALSKRVHYEFIKMFILLILSGNYAQHSYRVAALCVSGARVETYTRCIYFIQHYPPQSPV
jgi:hypothetical protein